MRIPDFIGFGACPHDDSRIFQVKRKRLLLTAFCAVSIPAAADATAGENEIFTAEGAEIFFRRIVRHPLTMAK